ncbi:MAG: hypothetical protein RIB45_08210 [Marivibrio sp.]|uniref:hypothetical protein n=1 Tax=Marivibrio sp. TaxID=2039719 RepID=UPI0032EB986F
MVALDAAASARDEGGAAHGAGDGVQQKGDERAPPGPPADTATRRVDLSYKARRASQPYELELDDAVYRFGSAAQLLTDRLEILESRWPGVLERLAQGKKRTKRPVARRREDLYDRPHPIEHSAERASGYFVATNNRADEVLGIMRRALFETGAAENPDRQVRRG